MNSSTNSTGVPGDKRRLNVLMSVLAALVGVLVCAYFVIGSQAFFDQISDTPEYIVSGKLLVSGRSASIYRLQDLQAARHKYFPALRERGLGVLYPPPALPLLAPFALLPADARASFFWLPVQAAAIVLSIFLLNKVYPLPLSVLGWFCSWVALFGPTYECLRIGQITPLLLVCLSIIVLSLHKLCSPAALTTAGSSGSNQRGPSVAAGVALAVFVIKPQEIVAPALFLLGARSWKIFAVASGVVLTLSLLVLLLCGPNTYSSFADMLLHVRQLSASVVPQIMPTVRGQLLRIGLLPEPVIGGVSLAFLLAVFWLSFSRGRAGGMRGAESDALPVTSRFLGVLPLGLLTAYACHTYDLLLLVPTAMALTYHFLGDRKRFQRGMWLALVSSLPFWLPIYAEINYGYLKNGGTINPFFLALAVFSMSTFWCLDTSAAPKVEPTD
jgi:hypothetical protein